MLGSNDSKPYNWTDSNTFKQHYLKLLDSYLVNGNLSEIYLCTLARVYYKDVNQVSGEAAFSVQADVVEEMNVVIKEVAMECGYKLIDIYSVTSSNRSLFQFDFVHPNVEGAKAIAEEIYKSIKYT
jgi:lysophospholipase L1-like esterase